MTFELLDSISVAGNPAKANEDAFGADARAAVVMDGATGLGDNLMPGPSDAAWLATFGARRLLAHLREGDTAKDAVTAARCSMRRRRLKRCADARHPTLGKRRSLP